MLVERKRTLVFDEHLAVHARPAKQRGGCGWARIGVQVEPWRARAVPGSHFCALRDDCKS